MKQENITTKLRLAEADAAFLADNLMRLPSSNELCLVNSTVEGEPAAISCSRTFFKRAIDLGCREFCLFDGKDFRVLCPGTNRTYVWTQLPPDGVIAPSDKASRVKSAEEPIKTTTNSPVPIPEPTKEEEPMARGRSEHNNQPLEEVHWRTVEPEQSPLLQAEALRDSLRDVLGKASDLISTLKRQRRHEKLVRSTIASLKELQKVAG
jgi:hypothetical protein